MQSVLIILVCLSLLTGTVYGCHPCKCGNWGWDGIWKNLKAADCRDASNLAEIPDTLDEDIAALVIAGQPIIHLRKNISRFKKLQILAATNNTIRYIDKDAFNMTNLKYLSLGGNALTELSPKLFANTPNLTKFWCYSNQLTILHENLFFNLPVLNEIHVEKNKISVIEDNCFVNLPSLEIVDLSTNLIKRLQLNMTYNLPSLNTLYLYNNYWSCDESLCEIMNAVVSRGFGGDKPIPTCVSPDNFRGKQWNELELKDFTPSIVSSITRLQEGDDMILQCQYCFASNISWTMNNRKISTKYHQIHNNSIISTMTLDNVRKEEAGKYTCHVENCGNCKEASTYVSVLENFSTATEIEIFTVENSIFEECCTATASTTIISSIGSISLLLIFLIRLIIYQE